MKTFPAILLIAIVAMNPLLAETKTADLKVLTDLEIAKKQSKETGKPVFLEFMSSSCGFCQAFKKNVLSDPNFIAYANEHLIVVIHDYDVLEKLPAEEKKKRETLMAKVKVDGFPTILLLDKTGKILLRTSGYNGADADKIIASLKQSLDPNK